MLLQYMQNLHSFSMQYGDKEYTDKSSNASGYLVSRIYVILAGTGFKSVPSLGITKHGMF